MADLIKQGQLALCLALLTWLTHSVHVLTVDMAVVKNRLGIQNVSTDRKAPNPAPGQRDGRGTWSARDDLW